MSTDSPHSWQRERAKARREAEARRRYDPRHEPMFPAWNDERELWDQAVRQSARNGKEPRS